MRAILKRTAYLFRQYPILWLPVLLADFLKFWVEIAGRRIAHIASSAVLHHSLISGMPEAPNLPRFVWFTVTAAIVKGTASLIGVVLYFYALGILARAITGPVFKRENDSPCPLDGVPTSNRTVEPKEAEIQKLNWSLPRLLLRSSALGLLAFVLASLGTLSLNFFLIHRSIYLSRYDFPWIAAIFVSFAGLLMIVPVSSFIAKNVLQDRNNDARLENFRLSACGTAFVLFVAYTFLYSFSIKAFDHAMGSPTLNTPFFRLITEMALSLVTAIPFIHQ